MSNVDRYTQVNPQRAGRCGAIQNLNKEHNVQTSFMYCSDRYLQNRLILEYKWSHEIKIFILISLVRVFKVSQRIGD